MIYNGDDPKITFKLSSIDRHYVVFDYYDRNGIISIAATLSIRETKKNKNKM